jgi:hypothetical protein
MRWLRAASVVVTLAMAVGVAPLWRPAPALADGCSDTLIADLRGSGDIADVSGQAASTCHTTRRPGGAAASRPYVTSEIVCSPNRQNSLLGLCSATPCALSGLYFAFRTVHYPGGGTASAGSQCVALGRAVAAPGVTAAEVFAAVRRVRLPGGRIGAVPGVRGLANLTSFFWLAGASRPPVDLDLRGSTVHATFRPVAYRWRFGDGQGLVTAGPGSPGLGSEVRVAYAHRGRYRVTAEVAWTAEAWLDGTPVGQVDGLASQAAATYPVAELATVLTG